MNPPNTESIRRLTENEAIFREYNEQVSHDLEQLTAIAVKHDDNNLFDMSHVMLRFFCECSDENCRERIALPIQQYQDIHTNRQQFIILPGHEVLEVEKIVQKDPDYYVVDKFVLAPEDPGTLNETEVENV